MSIDHQPNWRTSSYSGAGDNNCVEVADNQPQVMVRDTKQSGHGPTIAISPFAWRQFTATVAAESFRL
ncbi:DUF397 domain-containing protein [Streptomyces otsuchiensis]|uniref:DUF397 domain-containing protein n=1 Tax=Streptomyces otsuchiensis TaxID=2681388 RepID=UPI001D1313BC|nr:DUF397 domain-containing protein [Streptomyces otsuchiensis]